MADRQSFLCLSLQREEMWGQGYYIIVLKICRKAILSTKKTLLLQMYKEY